MRPGVVVWRFMAVSFRFSASLRVWRRSSRLSSSGIFFLASLISRYASWSSPWRGFRGRKMPSLKAAVSYQDDLVDSLRRDVQAQGEAHSKMQPGLERPERFIMLRESLFKIFRTAPFGFALIIAGCSSISANKSATNASHFPCPKAEPDFKALFKYTVEMAKKYQRSTDDFQRLTRPYGPLDISDASQCSEGEQRALRNFYYGLSARAFDANPTAITQKFFCQASCWEDRKAFAASKLGAISKLVEKFRALSKLAVISNWMGDGSYRFNDTFVAKDGSSVVALPSKGAGIITFR